MIAPKITDALGRLYSEEKHRIVFWYDADKEFDEDVGSLDIEGVSFIRLDEMSALEVKAKLELEDKQNKYLVYAPFPVPDLKDDWLVDIRLYSRTFYADRASILLDDLGLTSHLMRDHLIKRQSFLNNKNRLNKLKEWVRADDNEDAVDLKMLAVVVKSEQPEVFQVLMRLFSAYCSDGRCDLRTPQKLWDSIEKYGLNDYFWELMRAFFGYHHDEKNLSDLLLRIMVTDFVSHLKCPYPQSLDHLQLPNSSLSTNAAVFLSQWRGNARLSQYYDIISDHIGRELRIDDHIGDMSEDDLVDVMTFEAVEKRIARCLRDNLLEGELLNPSHIKEVISKRCDGYWASPYFGLNKEKSGNDYLATYKALESAADLHELRKLHDEGFSYPNAKAMYDAYVQKLFRFDQLYRLYHERATKTENRGWDILKELKCSVEACYSKWYVDQLAISWGRFFQPKDGEGLLDHWSLADITNQQDFFVKHIDKVLKDTPNGTVYVIVSDAFRFEVAQELAAEINGKKRFKADLASMLGVLPSYTALGKAALMPHEVISYKEDSSASVLLDGLPTSSIEQRSKILEKYQGVAIHSGELRKMSRDKGRSFAKPWRIIYVFQDQIDATGDKAATEAHTFNAVRESINELSDLVSHIINNLNGSQVFITADHGFLFREGDLTEQDRSTLGEKPANAIHGNKRYLIGRGLGEDRNIWKGMTHITAGTKDDMEFWIPKGASRFHFAGGAKFVHGGAMPQEIIVPVITVKELHGQAIERSSVKRVDVSILGNIRKIVNSLQRFEFIQTEAITERILPRTLMVSLRNGNDLISNEVALTFDSKSPSMDERKKIASLRVKAGQYDNKHEYSLVLRDPETNIEYLRIPIIIDLAFSSDF